MRTTSIITAAASVAALLTVAGQAQAQANRTFVSGHGEDTNPCSLAAPCRSFAQALTQTAAGGEITVLDSAGYGAVTITNSVTITNPGGVEAGVTASGQDAIQINGGTSNINVTLRGLTLQGASGNNGNGIDWVSGGGNLNIIDCVTKDFGHDGIVVEPASGSPVLDVTISKTAVLNNLANGIAIAPQTGAAAVDYSISHTVTNENTTGIFVGGDAAALGTISFVHSELNAAFGLSFNAANGDLTVTNSVLRHNTTDVTNGTGPGTTLYLYDSNTIGVFSLAPGAITNSDGTNNIVSITGGGSLTKVAPQ